MFIETAHESPKVLERGSPLPLSTMQEVFGPIGVAARSSQNIYRY
jgi:hypothetical protein